MTEAGFHQIQIDVELFRIKLWKFMVDEKVFGFLLDEVVGNAACRCKNGIPTGLTPEVQ